MRRADTGIALLISIFILLLISVVAIALIVSSGTESALAGNYRSSTGVYYAALAGVEEVRARLMSNDPNSFKNTDPSFLPAPGTPLPVCSVYYVLNPLGPETVTPWVAGSTYADTEFGPEFLSSGCSMPSSPPTANSIWNRSPLNTLAFPGPLYKWVRINAVSEQSLNLDVSPYDGSKSSTTPIYYDGTNLNDTTTGNQVLEITALAVQPNASGQNSQKILQYIVAPQPLSLSFPAALTLDGTTPQFTASPSSSYWIQGNDQGSVGSCAPSSTPSNAVGFTDTSYAPANFEQPGNSKGIPAGLLNKYTNGVATNPDIVPVTLSPDMSTVGGLNSLVQTIQQNPDAVFNSSICVGTSCAVQTTLPAAMSATNPMTIVVNGDMTFNGWRQTGYGLLLVTGQLTYDPDASWDGIILVIGKGSIYSHQGSYTNTQILGAVLIANTQGLPVSSAPASSSYDFFSTPTTLTNGIYYSSCWIQAATPRVGYKILSFHEIAQ
jgi:hypothetical protein